MNELERVEAKTSELVESALSVEGLIEQVRLIQNVMKSVMKDGEHYGTIEGTKSLRFSSLVPKNYPLSFAWHLNMTSILSTWRGDIANIGLNVGCDISRPGRSWGKVSGPVRRLRANIVTEVEKGYRPIDLFQRSIGI